MCRAYWSKYSCGDYIFSHYDLCDWMQGHPELDPQYDWCPSGMENIVTHWLTLCPPCDRAQGWSGLMDEVVPLIWLSLCGLVLDDAEDWVVDFARHALNWDGERSILGNLSRYELHPDFLLLVYVPCAAATWRPFSDPYIEYDPRSWFITP